MTDRPASLLFVACHCLIMAINSQPTPLELSESRNEAESCPDPYFLHELVDPPLCLFFRKPFQGMPRPFAPGPSDLFHFSPQVISIMGVLKNSAWPDTHKESVNITDHRRRTIYTWDTVSFTTIHAHLFANCDCARTAKRDPGTQPRV